MVEACQAPENKVTGLEDPQAWIVYGKHRTVRPMNKDFLQYGSCAKTGHVLRYASGDTSREGIISTTLKLQGNSERMVRVICAACVRRSALGNGGVQ
jgi:hypothetical protein